MVNMFLLKSNSFFALIVLVFIIINTTTTSVEGALCERASQTWSWNGACHTRDGKKMCFCYFDTCSAPFLCERASQTWSGDCSNTTGCDRQCQPWERAAHGACTVVVARKSVSATLTNNVDHDHGLVSCHLLVYYKCVINMFMDS
ncbi:hypothetical protein MKX01_013272 [Papaver californicum]|nr:hypothetical protein MKX01_013272 [Papaver californicum]